MKTRGSSFNLRFVICALLLVLSPKLWADPPANDDFANRITLSGAPVSGVSTTVDATREPFEPTEPLDPYGVIETVWWTWTAPADGTVTIDTTGSDIDPEYVNVYNGASIDQLHTVALDSLNNQDSQTITFPTVAGAVYQISVGNDISNGTGTVYLNIRLGDSNITAPVIVGTPADANDNFASRATLAGAAVAGIGYNFDATRESLEAQDSGYRTLWWTWTAPADGILTVDSSSSTFDNILMAFSGDALGTLDVLGSAGNPSYNFTIPVNAGIAYQFSIGSNDGGDDDTGAAVLDLSFFAPPPFFDGESALSNGVYYLQFSNGNYFGYYSYLTDPHYIFHFDLGYEYVFDASDGKSGVYLYDFYSKDFFYTSPTFPFPYLYDFGLQSVLYYYPNPNDAGRYDTDGYRFFYDFNTGKVISK